MADGYLQLGALLYYLLHLSHLCGTVLQLYAQYLATGLHHVHQLHHLVGQELLWQSCGGHLHASECLDHCWGYLYESWMAIVHHAKRKETVGIAALHLYQIAVLYAVDKLLGNHSCSHLGIVHVAQEAFGRVLSVGHVWRQHLSLFAKKQRTAAIGLKLADTLSVYHRVLVQPQMAVSIYYEFFHLTNIWSPMISCTLRTSSSSIGSFTY